MAVKSALPLSAQFQQDMLPNIRGSCVPLAFDGVEHHKRDGARPRAAASAAIVCKSDNRNKRAFSCILNYIMSTSAVYKLFMRDFRRNGIAVYSFIQAFGPLPAPPRIVRARDDAWSRMTMDALRIPYTLTGYFRWTELVQEQARKLGKDGTKQKEKFIDGLPSFFNTEKTAMRHDTRFVFPPLYGAIPGFSS